MNPPRDGKAGWLFPLIGAFTAAFFVAYVVKGIGLYAFQRLYLYQPLTSAVDAPAAYGLPYVQDITRKTGDGLDLRAWFMPPPRGKPVAR